MSYLHEYTLAMDFVRERFDLPDTVSMYEAVAKVVSEYKLLEEKLQKSEATCLKKPKKTQSKSKK